MMILCPLRKVLERLNLPTDLDAMTATALGMAVQLTLPSWPMPPRKHMQLVIGAIESGQYSLFCDRYARPLAYVSWARVDNRINAALLKDGPQALSDGGWAAGPTPWVVDLVARDGSLGAVMAYLRDDIFARDDAVTYFRFRRKRRLVKQICRQDLNGFVHARSRALVEVGYPVDNPTLYHGVAEILTARHALGRCIQALRCGANYRESPLWAEPARLSVLQTLRLVRVYDDSKGRPVGLLAWVWLTTDALRRIKIRPLEQLHSSEWHEGGCLCLWELHASPEVLPQILRDIETDLFPREQEVWLYRARHTKRLQRVLRSSGAADLHEWCAEAVPAALKVPA